MKSQIVLYKQCKILPNKNFILDQVRLVNNNYISTLQLEMYLSGLSKETINDYQYIKQQLSISIKINASQTGLVPNVTNNINYVKIRNYSQVEGGSPQYETAYYYFVISKKWLSTNTIEFVLSLDTLNTFYGNYEIDKKTLVQREHKDRFWKQYSSIKTSITLTTQVSPTFPSAWVNKFLDGGTFSFSNANTSETKILYNKKFRFTTIGLVTGLYFYNLDEEESQWFDKNKTSGDWTLDSFTYNEQTFVVSIINYFNEYTYITQYNRKIDLKSEDISCPVYKEKENVINDSLSVYNWSLYYKNQDNQDNSPVDCFLVSDENLKLKVPSGTNSIDVNDLIDTDTYIIFPIDTYQGQITFAVDGEIFTIHVDEIDEAYDHYIQYRCIAFTRNGAQLDVSFPVYQIQRGTNTYKVSGTWNSAHNNATALYLGSLASLKLKQVSGALVDYTTSLPDSDTTLSMSLASTITLNTKQNIDRTLEENLKIINIPYCPTDFDIDSNYVVTPSSSWTYDSTYKFLRLEDRNIRFTHQVISNIPDILDIFSVSLTINTALTRTWLDSKLYHSDYYRPKFVYDSFYKTFALEHINYWKSVNIRASSYFNFEFIMSRNIVSKFLFKFNYAYDYANEDYENVVAVARNNEEVLYNSQYLSYVRTGYNYDLKAKERQEVTSGVTIGLSALGLVASAVIGGATGNPMAIGGIVGSAISLTTSLISYAKTTAQNEENIQRKLQESQRQAVSVLNADDYDLLYAYSSNRAKLCVYKVSPNMEKILDDLFYYGGYIVNEQRLPNYVSRYRFNFVQANLVIKQDYNIPEDIVDDIKEKWSQGVTFIHYNSSDYPTYDLDQEYENWERSLL